MPSLNFTPARVAAGAVAKPAVAVSKPVIVARTTGRNAARSLRIARSSAHTGRLAWAKSIKVAVQVGWLRGRLRSQRLWSPRRVVSARAPELAVAVVAGAGVEYLLDPADGRRRRQLIRDRVFATGRRAGRRGVQQARYVEGKAEGALHGVTSTPSPPADDRALADRVRTEIFRPADAPKGSVNVSAVDAIVYLRGEVASPEEIDRLIGAARQVPGVRAVESLLHTPGTPAPMGGAA
jgi:osmotically-inducible protein OsmY